MKLPKDSRVLKRIKNIQKIMEQVENVRFDLDQEQTERYTEHLDQVRQEYRNFMSLYEMEELDRNHGLTMQNAAEYMDLCGRIADVTNQLCDMIQKNGDSESKEQYSSFRWLSNQFSRDLRVMNGYQGIFPTRLQDLYKGEDLNPEPATHNTFKKDIGKIAGLYSTMLKLDDNTHVNSPSFRGMKSALIALAKYTKEISDKYNLVPGVESDPKSCLTDEESLKMGKLMDDLYKANRSYIHSKGIGSQYTTLGKDRMNMAVEMEKFLVENLATYPSEARIIRANEHANEMASRPGVMDMMKEFRSVDINAREDLNESIILNFDDDDKIVVKEEKGNPENEKQNTFTENEIEDPDFVNRSYDLDEYMGMEH